jgi:2'-5' RNA ligase
VLWAGVEEDAAILPRLAKIAERIARGAGLPPEDRPFVSHVTLGRVRREGNAHDLERVLSAERGVDAGAFTVEAVSLFSSELTPQGARYTRLHRLTLDGLSSARSL